MHRGRVVTPIYDPVGDALPYFEETSKSVLRQRAQNFDWIISIQSGTNSLYHELVEGFAGDNIIVHQTRAHGLGEHLSILLAEQDLYAWTHILCQDDVYSSLQATAIIETSLLKSDVLFLQPTAARNLELPSAVVEARVPKWKRRLASIPINRVGGLSCLAWRETGPPLACDYEQLADLDLMRQLLGRCAQPLCISGIIAEARWPGQAQHELSRQANREYQRWVENSLEAGLRGILLNMTIADIFGYPELAEFWAARSASPGIHLRHLTKALGRTLGVARRLYAQHRMS